jgi:hypothetical protein
MIIDRSGGYVSTDHELQVKLLQENMKEKGLILPKDKVLEQRIVIVLKRTHISGLCALGKSKGRMKES